jgi:hypothetical protein
MKEQSVVWQLQKSCARHAKKCTETHGRNLRADKKKSGGEVQHEQADPRGLTKEPFQFAANHARPSCSGGWGISGGLERLNLPHGAYWVTHFNELIGQKPISVISHYASSRTYIDWCRTGLSGPFTLHISPGEKTVSKRLNL